jgi:prolyl oligopeptidase
MKFYAHKLGSDGKTDQAVFGYEVCPGVKVGEDEFGSVSPAPGSSYAIGVVNNGAAPALEIYLTPLSAIANKTSWKKVASYDDNIVDSALVGSDLYLVTLKGAPNGKILRVSAADSDLSKAEVVLPATSAVLIGSFGWTNILRPAKDALYFQQAEAGVVKVLRLPYRPGSELEPVSLPLCRQR